ncbi:MAG: hypothetical protein ACLUUF_02200 [Bifidobacterium pullorum]
MNQQTVGAEDRHHQAPLEGVAMGIDENGEIVPQSPAVREYQQQPRDRRAADRRRMAAAGTHRCD